MTTFLDRSRFRLGRRILIGCAGALLVAACGGGGGDSSDAGGAADPAGSASASAAGATFDQTLLPTTPVDPGILTVVEDTTGSGNGAWALESVVDECSTIDATTVTSIVTNADTLGVSYDFAAETFGRASCLFKSETHGIEIFVNRADAIDDDLMEELNGFGGEVSTRPGGAGEAATLYFEDSFDLVTFYAARAERNGWAVVVINHGGTGVLGGGDEEDDAWGDLALAALDGVADSDPPAGETETAIQADPDPCAVYDPSELGAALETELTETFHDDDRSPDCTWKNGDDTVEVRLSLGPASEGLGWFGATEATGDGVYRLDFGNGSVVFRDGLLFQVVVAVRTDAYGLEPYEFGGVNDRDTQPLVDALVANIIERTS